jgi:hypothetical protein
MTTIGNKLIHLKLSVLSIGKPKNCCDGTSQIGLVLYVGLMPMGAGILKMWG